MKVTPTFDLGSDNLTTDDPATVTWMHTYTAESRGEAE